MPATAATPFVVASAGVGIVGLVLVFIVRAARPQERAEIDNAIGVAVQEMQPEVDAIGRRLQAEVIAPKEGTSSPSIPRRHRQAE